MNMKAGFVQFSPEFGKVDENIDKAMALIEKADAELIVLPELFSTGYLFVSVKEALNLAEEIPTGKTTKALCSIAKKKKIHIVATAITDSNLFWYITIAFSYITFAICIFSPT